MNRSNLIHMAGGQDKARAALEALKASRPELVEAFNSDPNSTQADVILELAIRQAKAKAPAQQRNPFANFSAKEVVTAESAQAGAGITAREYAESLMALRKSKQWDGQDYEHPKVKELSNRMMQNINSVRTGRAESAIAGGTSAHSGLDLGLL